MIQIVIGRNGVVERHVCIVHIACSITRSSVHKELSCVVNLTAVLLDVYCQRFVYYYTYGIRLLKGWEFKMNKITSIFFALLGWFMGVHFFRWVCVSLWLIIVICYLAKKHSGLEDVIIFIAMVLPFIGSMLLSSLIYGDMWTTITSVDFSMIFTGE